MPFSFAFTRLNALQAAVRHSLSLSDPVLHLVTQANNLIAFLKYLLGLIRSNEKQRIECNDGSFKVLDSIGNLSFGSYAHAFTSLSPVARNQVWVSHLIRFQQPMSETTNDPSRKPIREPTND